MKWLNRLSILISAVCLFGSCENDDDIIWDFPCYSASIYPVDVKTGISLLDPEYSDNAFEQNINVEYNGKIYPVTIDSRANIPMPLALRYKDYDWYWNNEKNCAEWVTSHHLEFGEFSPSMDYHGEEFTIHWGDGTSNKVRFDCYIVWRSKTKPKVVEALWLDGVLQDDWAFTIRK